MTKQVTKAELRSDISTAEYHSIEAASASQLWDLFNECPAAMNAKDYREPSEAMIRGTYLDRELLHGDGADFVAIRPEGINARTKDGRAELAALKAEADDAGKLWLEKRPDWMAVLDRLCAAARAHPEVGPLLRPDYGLTHPVILWTDKATGEPCKAELDKVVAYEGSGAVFDLKSAPSAHPRAFDAAVWKFGYYFKMAWYEYALQQVKPGPDRWLLLGVLGEKDEQAALYPLDIGYHEAGKRQIREALTTYHECKKSGVWPGYPTQVLEAPQWLT